MWWLFGSVRSLHSDFAQGRVSSLGRCLSHRRRRVLRLCHSVSVYWRRGDALIDGGSVHSCLERVAYTQLLISTCLWPGGSSQHTLNRLFCTIDPAFNLLQFTQQLPSLCCPPCRSTPISSPGHVDFDRFSLLFGVKFPLNTLTAESSRRFAFASQVLLEWLSVFV